jgi:predicted AAA+ superfamily ATPase
MYPRLVSDRILKSAKSVFLLGPRQTGKSTLVKNLKPDLGASDHIEN